MAQELLTTFADDPELVAITLSPTKPPAPGGEFCVQSYDSISDEGKTLWSFKEKGSFPDIKALKRIVRDIVSPMKSLGHSDVNSRASNVGDTLKDAALEGHRFSTEAVNNASDGTSSHADESRWMDALLRTAPNLAITYSTASRLLLRAAWLAHELVSITADTEGISSVTLIPNRSPSSDGSFIVSIDGRVIWDRAERGGFPDVVDIRQALYSRAPP